MIHPDTCLQFVSAEVGVGVFATAPIPKGTIVYARDPLEIELSPQQFDRLDEPFRSIAAKYSFIDRGGTRVISWDLAKYVNHRCACNTISTGYGFEIAIRDVAAGEEITDEYGLFNMEHEIHCRCDSPDCREVIRAGDVDTYHERWDASVVDALGHARDVDQPLWDVLDDETREAVAHYLDTGEGFASVLRLKWSGADTNGRVPPVPRDA